MDRKIEKKKWTRSRLALISGLVLVSCFALYTFLFADHSSSLNVETDRITVAQVKEGTFQEFISIDGSVEPLKTVYLDIVEGGRVERIYTDDGRMVQRGDTLMKLSNTTLQMDFMNRESQLFDLVNERSNSEVTMKQDLIKTLNSLAEIDYQLALAKRKYQRNQELIKDKVISKEEFDQAQDEYEYLQRRYQLAHRSLKQDSVLMRGRLRQLDESIRRMRANIGMARTTLNNLYVLAPISGQLATLRAEVGESMPAGENVGQIDDLKGFKVRASIDQHYISRISAGLKGSFDFGGKTYALTITNVLPEVTNGQFAVEMQFEKTPEQIRRGQTLQIRLHLTGGSAAVLLPRGGFYQSTGGSWVFVVDKSGAFAGKRSIQLGRQNPEFYEVVSGLKPGEQVIVSSYDSYGDIEKLKLK